MNEVVLRKTLAFPDQVGKRRIIVFQKKCSLWFSVWHGEWWKGWQATANNVWTADNVWTNLMGNRGDGNLDGESRGKAN